MKYWEEKHSKKCFDHMKILNLFSGIGGNRMLWGSHHHIVAVELNESIANYYKKIFPEDVVVVGDAYDYLEKHFTEFDFIWASPPCQSHTVLSKLRTGRAYNKTYTNDIIKIPDMRLYGMIIFLNHLFRGDWVVENVRPYYEPIIKPTSMIGRHYIWSNVPIPSVKHASKIHLNSWKEESNKKGIYTPQLNDYKFDIRKDVVIHNCVNANIGKYILDFIVDFRNRKCKSCKNKGSEQEYALGKRMF